MKIVEANVVGKYKYSAENELEIKVKQLKIWQ